MSAIKKHIFIVIRYSVLSTSKAWLMSREDDFEHYKNKLFAAQRLDSKFTFFSKLVLPALDKQQGVIPGQDFSVLLLTSAQLPANEQARLATLVKARPWLHLIPVAVEQSIPAAVTSAIKPLLAAMQEDVCFASARLDDDDVLSAQYCQALLKYITPDFTNHVVTFPKGFECLYDDTARAVTESIQIDYPKVAVGLAHINGYQAASKTFAAKCVNVFQAGNHTKVDERFAMVEERSYFAYVKMAHCTQDTAEAAFLKRKSKAKAADESRIRQYFNLPHNFFAVPVS